MNKFPERHKYQNCIRKKFKYSLLIIKETDFITKTFSTDGSTSELYHKYLKMREFPGSQSLGPHALTAEGLGEDPGSISG